MGTPEIIEKIIAEPEFKEICDRILRTEVSPLVQLYGGKGGDGGVDADYEGTFDGVTGRWVFQYKFVSPATDPDKARARIKRYFDTAKGKSEFRKPGVGGVSGYVLLTTAPITVGCRQQIAQWFQEIHGAAKFCIWGRAAINSILVQHPELARSRGQEMENLCLKEVITPLWRWLQQAMHICTLWGTGNQSKGPLWPVRHASKSVLVPNKDANSTRPFKSEHRFVLYCDDPLLHEPNLQTQIARIDPYALEYASTTVFPNALRHLENVRTSLVDTYSIILEKVQNLVTELQRKDSLWITPPPVHHEVLSAAFSFLAHSWGKSENSIATSRGVHLLKPEQIPLLLTPMTTQYQYGKNLPTDVTKARQQLHKSIATLATNLWHPAKIGMDAPKPEPE